MSNRFGLYPCTFNNALHFTQLGTARGNPGVQLHETFPAGSVYRKSAITAFADPRFTISTEDVLTPFGTPTVSPVAGYACSAASVFRYQQRTDGATFAGSGNHVLATCAKGFLAPSSLTAQQDGAAMCDFAFWPLFDGSNLPIVYADDQNLAQTPAWNSTYFLGPAYLDDAGTPLQLPTLVDLRIDFGIDFRTKRADGDLFARVGYIYRVAPVVTLTFDKTSMLDSGAAKGDLGVVFGEYFGPGATNPGAISLFLLRGSTTGAGGREVVSDADHCRLRIFQGEWHPDSIDVQEEGDTATTIAIRPTFDGTNPPISIDATSVASL